jgi:hypothetical protein
MPDDAANADATAATQRMALREFFVELFIALAS